MTLIIATYPKGKTLELETEKIGLIQYSEKDIFQLPSGLFGFETEKEYILYPSDNVHPFIWFQSTKSMHLAFLLIDPQLIRPDYQLQLKRSDLPDLHLEDGDQNKIYVIATVPGDTKDITLNFQGPIVFNMTKNLTQQVIMEDEDLRAPLFAKTAS